MLTTTEAICLRFVQQLTVSSVKFLVMCRYDGPFVTLSRQAASGQDCLCLRLRALMMHLRP
eukprot:1999663-Pyramimonas_sp.AAC.1